MAGAVPEEHRDVAGADADITHREIGLSILVEVADCNCVRDATHGEWGPGRSGEPAAAVAEQHVDVAWIRPLADHGEARLAGPVEIAYRQRLPHRTHCCGGRPHRAGAVAVHVEH